VIWCQLRRLSVIKLAKVKEQSWSLLFYKLLVFHCLRSSHHLIRLSVVDSQCSRANPYAIKTVLVLQPVQISFHNVLSSQYNLKIEAFPWVVPQNFAARHWSWYEEHSPYLCLAIKEWTPIKYLATNTVYMELLVQLIRSLAIRLWCSSVWSG